MAVNFSDERYVRIYTRDTLTWKLWHWETRSVFLLLMRKVDRSGVLDIGNASPGFALAALVEIPEDVATRALNQLVASGTVVIADKAIVLPKYLEAQEATQTDRVRQQESRSRRKAAAMVITTGSVTKRDDVSRNVTECHELSQAVTGGHELSQVVTPAVPCLAVPSRAEPAVPNQIDVEQARPVEVLASNRPSKKRATTTADARILEVFEHWKQVLNHPKAKLGDERERAVKARLAQGYTVDDLKRAVDGCAVTPHNMGQNDRGEVYDDLALICRDGGQVERFMRNAESPPVAARSASAPVPPSDFGPSTGPIVATIGSLF